MRLKIITFALIILLPQVFAATYYVRTDGNNANWPCVANSSNGACRNIDYVADRVVAGDTVRVQPGTYVETVSPAVSGTVNNPISIVADGAVTCAMSFNSKSYIRTIGITVDPTTSGCSAGSHGITGVGTNTGLEFWNVNTNHTQKAILFDQYDWGSGVGRCNSCIILGGSITNVGAAGSDGGLIMNGVDWLAGYINFDSIDYIAVAPGGNRCRMINLDISNLLGDQPGWMGAHPDGFYAQTWGTDGFSNCLIESTFAVGTPTGDDNKFQHFENQAPVPWNDNILRFNVVYNFGSGFHSMYNNPQPLNRWRYYSNTIVYNSRAINNIYSNGCGNVGNVGGSVSFINNIFFRCWSDAATNLEPIGQTAGTFTIDYNLGYDDHQTPSWLQGWTNQAHDQTQVNPNLHDINNLQFWPDAGSGNGANARGTGGPLTTATSCSGNTLNVAANTGSFFIGDNSANLPQYGGKLAPGDQLTVGASTTRRVVSVSGDAITVDSALTCSNGDPVYFGNSTTIDIGAYPYKAGGYSITNSLDYNDNDAVQGVAPITASVNDPSQVRFVEFWVDGIPVAIDNSAPYTYVWDTSSLAQGSVHTIKAIARPLYASKVLAYEDSAAVTIGTSVPDTTPPIISGVSSSSIGQTTATITWTTDEASGSEVNYGLMTAYGTNTNNTALVTSHSQQITGLTQNMLYHYRVKSRDASGNLATSTDFTFTTTAPDTTPPSQVTELTATAASSSQINLAWTAATDDVGVTGYEIFRAGVNIANATLLSFSNTGLSAGTAYWYTVAAFDAAGNTGLESSSASATTFTPDTTPPTVSITSPAGGTVLGTITISAAANDNAGVAGVQLRVDGNNIGSEDPTMPYSITWDSSSVANGTHSITAIARDAAGNTATSNSISINIQNAAAGQNPMAGLVGYWNFDEGSGSIAADSSGNGNTGTLVNGPTWNSSGRVGGALHFDGNNDYISVPSMTSTLGDITVSAWVWMDSAGIPEPDRNNAIWASSNGLNRIITRPAGHYIDLGSSGLVGGSGSNIGQWIHFALVRNGASMTLYRNNISVQTAAASGQVSLGSTMVGRDNEYNTYYFLGNIDELRIYNRSLSQLEISQLYSYTGGSISGIILRGRVMRTSSTPCPACSVNFTMNGVNGLATTASDGTFMTVLAQTFAPGTYNSDIVITDGTTVKNFKKRIVIT